MNKENKSHLSGELTLVPRECDSRTCSPATPLSLEERDDGMMGFCRLLATSITVAKMELEP